MTSMTAKHIGRPNADRPVHLDFPAGFPMHRLAPLAERASNGERLVDVDADYRRAVTRNDPLLFALIYLPHHLTLDRGEYDLISISEWHLDVVQHARSWISGRPSRSAWIAPRKSAKSTWVFLILVLWALAHGWRRFALAFANTQEQATGHLATLRAELSGNEMLLDDFPELTPARTPGARDTLRTVTRGGSAMAARGVDSQALGIKAGAVRPDLILLDDIEPDEANHSMAKARNRLASLQQAILPMNEDATVMIVGTVTMYGSVMHDLVMHALGERTAPWIAETEFEAHYYPAILDEGTPRERSLWPAMWSLRWLKRKRGPADRPSRAFALNYMNRPELVGGLYWTHDLIVHDRTFESADYVLTIDTAVTNGENSDMTALVVTGINRAGTRVCVEYAYAGRITGTELRQHVHMLKRQNPNLRRALIEGNQGGERWREILNPMPAGLALDVVRPDRRGSKRDRLEWLLDQYQRGAVVHRSRHSALEDQMIAWPKVAHDDLLDAVEAGVAFHLGLPIS